MVFEGEVVGMLAIMGKTWTGESCQYYNGINQSMDVNVNCGMCPFPSKLMARRI